MFEHRLSMRKFAVPTRASADVARLPSRESGFVRSFSSAAAGDQALLESLVAAAVLAPSSHNTQPWRFRISRDRLDVRADESRALAINDPDHRELTISCGAALFNARVAAAHAGRRLDVVLLPDAADPLLLASARLDGSDPPLAVLYPATERRRTYRGTFSEVQIPPWLEDRLQEAASAEGAFLDILSADGRDEFVSLVATGTRRQFADPDWRRELAAWIRPRSAGDGLASQWLMAVARRAVVGRLDLGRTVADAESRRARSAPILAVLRSRGDSARDWLHTGQALERVLLTAAAAGIHASFFNQPIQVAEMRPRVDALLSGRGCAQLGLGLGQPHSVIAAAPRRDLDDVLEKA